MNKFLGTLFLVFSVVGILATPASAAAETLTSTQIIKVTATVAPARSIILNKDGQITKILSNTKEDVTPSVYLNKPSGVQKKLTPELQKQYQKVINDTDNLVGVEIPVEPQVTSELPSILGTIIKPQFPRL